MHEDSGLMTSELKAKGLASQFTAAAAAAAGGAPSAAQVSAARSKLQSERGAFQCL